MELRQETPSVDPRVQIALNYHFTDPRAGNLRSVLTYLSERPMQEIGTAELRHLVNGVDVHATSKVLRRLAELTSHFADAIGFTVTQTRRTNTGTFYRFDFIETSDKQGSKNLTTISRLPSNTPFTEADFRRTSGLVSLPLLREPPNEKEVASLFTNARFVRHETSELAYLNLLTEAARRQMTCSLDFLRTELGIPGGDKRLSHNLRESTVERATEVGFVVDSIRNRYHGIFFVDPAARERALLEKFSGKGEANTWLDKTLPFYLEILEARLKKVRLENLSTPKRQAIRLIARAQAEGKPLHRDDFLKQTGFTKSQYGYLHHKSQIHRYEWGFYIRTRSDNTMQCVLIDLDSIDESE